MAKLAIGWRGGRGGGCDGELGEEGEVFNEDEGSGTVKGGDREPLSATPIYP
jgi:hypothetical protein